MQACKDCMRRQKWEYRTKQRTTVHAIFGSCCARCGNDDWRVLEVDHINGGGTADRLTGRVDQAYSRKLIDYLHAHRDEFQLLCANCHKIKTWEDRDRQRADFPVESLEARAKARLQRAEHIAEGRRKWWAEMTPEERSAYSQKGADARGRKTHCLRGHEFTDENTHVDRKGTRICRTCKRERMAEARARRRVERES